MNGLGLLVALAAVGVNVEWEATSSGTSVYTIRVESLVIDQLRDGSAIESLVDKNDRRLLRRFRVAVGPKNQQTARDSGTAASEVDYGWRPNETGGIDYYVQISRERLETLASGIPLECVVHSDVPEIERIYVFVGDAQLPRELPQATRNASPPRDFDTITDVRSGRVSPASGTEANPGTARYGNADYGTPNNTPASASNADSNSRYNATASQVNNGQTGTQASAAASRYGLGDNTLPVPPPDNSRAIDYDRNRDPSYDYNRNLYAAQQEALARQQSPPMYSPSLAQTAALPQQQYASQPIATVAAAQPQTNPNSPATNPAMDALAAVVALQQKQLEQKQAAASKEPVESETKSATSSKPLILTTLALLASIGANAYLGWLAWSFFWRFRDAASDLSRARSNAFPAGGAAGH